ncbi:MAG: PAS domain S-box protein [Acidobacteria bacterium]|nr:PAS domain S-box protein [Acidobacteriota bacterium]
MTDSGTSGDSPRPFGVVGIGASAGGLEAFLEFFRALPTPIDMAFVLLTHLEPTHESQLVAIVSGITRLSVSQAKDQEPVKPNHLYILPPNAEMAIQNGVLQVTPRNGECPHYPIDRFFESLAEDRGASAVGIVLSGGGSDGAQGLRAIKSHFGMTYCQDPLTAQHSAMPHSAVATGAVDAVLSPAEIARSLSELPSHPSPAPISTDDELDTSPEDRKHFSRILGLLKARHAVDFNQYKPSTISRRIARRSMIRHTESLAEYARYLEAHPAELDDLYRDVLICVTSFFREPAMFERLQEIVPDMLQGRKPAEPFRIWVAGCATGEEAYSFAIAIVEIIEASGKPIPIQVFGTDISDTAIDRARSGIFSDKIQEAVSPERLRRFFSRVDSGYRIAENIRQHCIFARHDLTADPPFSQMDILSCRNVLIYLGSTSQNRILPALHYGLRSGGLLILGSAETIGRRSDLFSTVDAEHKIFARKAVPGRVALEFGTDAPIRSLPEIPNPIGHEVMTLVDLETRATRLLRDHYAPPGVIVNEDMQVMHFHGQTGFYLEPVPGEASLNLLRLARESLIYPLRNLVERAIKSKGAVEEPGIRVERDGEVREITLRVLPVSENEPSYLVLFEESLRGTKDHRPASIPADQESGTDLPLADAQRELGQMRDYLRKVIEQHEAANEELRAANEEARSSNEELQSTNEELRTTKEELQSSNEELTTVNDELKHRNDELRLATNDLTNVLSAADIPIAMVDMDLRLRRFTPAAERLLGLSPSDIGQKLIDARYAFPVPNLLKMLRATLDQLTTQSERAQDRQGRWFEVFVRPYRTADNRIDGAIVAFIDVDDSKRALEEADHARQFAEGIVETVQHPLLVLDQELRILRATDAFYRTFDAVREETEGRLVSELGTGQWNFPELHRLMETALIRDVPFRDLDIEHDFPKIGRRTMRLNARRIVSGGHPQRLLLAIEDVTERKESAEIQYRRLFESARDAVVIVSARTGEVIDVNPYFSELTRYQRAEVAGECLWDLQLFLHSDEARQIVSTVREKSACRYDSVRVRARDGAELILEIIASSYRVRDSEFVQVNIRDVTERRRMEDRLRSSNLDLQQFAFAASHDLQEPLRTVTSFSELLKKRLEGKLDEDGSRYLGFIVSAADRMRQMVLDLLGYSQILRADARPSLIHTEAVLSSVLLNLQMAIHGSDARVTFDPLPSVVMDQTHLTQLMQNIIGNAIKYRSEAPPLIHLSAREVGLFWEFSVRDNGTGIEPRYAEHVFTIFKRLHGPDRPGSGIGLAICKRIVERYGGRIWVDSAPGTGSTFYFTVPKEPLQ